MKIWDYSDVGDFLMVIVLRCLWSCHQHKLPSTTVTNVNVAHFIQDINLKTSLSGQNNLRQIQMGDSLMIKDSFVNSDWLTVYPSTRRYNFSWWNNNWFIGYRSGFSLMSKINIIVSSPGLKYLLGWLGTCLIISSIISKKYVESQAIQNMKRSKLSH